MTKAIIFDTRAEAEAHVRTLDRSAAYARGGRPALPRCDSGRWGDPEIRQGARCVAACPCKRRDAPEAGCPYVTWRSADVRETDDGRLAVIVSEAHTRGGIDTRTAVDVEEDAAGRIKEQLGEAGVERGRM